MKAHDSYLKFVLWNEEDGVYVGYCPDLFPWGGVCDDMSEERAYSQLCALVRDEVQTLYAEGKPLPPGTTRAIRDAISV
jgi:hypothetical protein